MPNVEPSAPTARRAGVLPEPPAEALQQKHTLRLLEHTRAYLLDPRHWTQGAMARNSQGREVEPEEPACIPPNGTWNSRPACCRRDALVRYTQGKTSFGWLA